MKKKTKKISVSIGALVVTASIALTLHFYSELLDLKKSHDVLHNKHQEAILENEEMHLQNAELLDEQTILKDSLNQSSTLIEQYKSELKKKNKELNTLENKIEDLKGKTVSQKSKGKTQKGKKIEVTATAYTAKCEGCSGVTATGVNLLSNPNQKVIAVDPSLIPLGTEVYVEGYGHAIAADTGGAIKGHKIDIHVPTKNEAFNWGRREVTVTMLN